MKKKKQVLISKIPVIQILFFFILKEVFEINSILVSKFMYIIQDIDRLCLLFYNPRWQKTTKRSLRGIATFWQRMRYNNMQEPYKHITSQFFSEITASFAAVH